MKDFTVDDKIRLEGSRIESTFGEGNEEFMHDSLQTIVWNAIHESTSPYNQCVILTFNDTMITKTKQKT